MIVTPEDLATALEKAPLGVLVLRQGRIAWLNETLAGLAGQAKAEFIGRLVAETVFAQWQDGLVEVATDTGPRWLQRHRIEPCGEAEVHYYQDLTEQVRLREAATTLHNRLRNLETTDPVTGIKNRRAILQELDRQISRSRRYDNPLAVIRLTLETEGDPERHQELMRTISQSLKDKLRWADEIGLLDGRTFLLVLPETSLEDAKELAVKLMGDRAAFQFDDGAGRVRYGVAAWHKGDDLRKLLRRVEKDQEINLSALLS